MNVFTFIVVDLDQTPRYVVFELGMLCLPILTNEIPKTSKIYSTELKTQHLIYPTFHSSWHIKVILFYFFVCQTLTFTVLELHCTIPFMKWFKRQRTQPTLTRFLKVTIL